MLPEAKIKLWVPFSVSTAAEIYETPSLEACKLSGLHYIKSNSAKKSIWRETYSSFHSCYLVSDFTVAVNFLSFTPFCLCFCFMKAVIVDVMFV